MLKPQQIVCDSATVLGTEARGAVVLCGSHGGVYPAYLAAAVGVCAVIFNDAGVGREGAGIAGLHYLQTLGIAAAATSHGSARIGDGADASQRGRISYANAAAALLGIVRDMPVREAMERLSAQADQRQSVLPKVKESRTRLPSVPSERLAVVLLDSASLVDPQDRGQIIVTGSHGGLLGGRPETALKIEAFAAGFNDADVGIDHAGIGRLPALDTRAIAAATVSAWSARIGDGQSSYRDGFISHLNDIARHYGATIGMSTRDFVHAMQGAARGKGDI